MGRRNLSQRPKRKLSSSSRGKMSSIIRKETLKKISETKSFITLKEWLNWLRQRRT
jgi:hypothetical protein